MKEWTLTILGTLVCISLAANAVLWNGYRGAIEKKTELQIQFDAQLKNQRQLMPQSQYKALQKGWLTSAQKREKLTSNEWRQIIQIGLVVCCLMMCCACSQKTKTNEFMPPDFLLNDCLHVEFHLRTNADLVHLIDDLFAALEDCTADKQALRAYMRSLDADHGQK